MSPTLELVNDPSGFSIDDDGDLVVAEGVAPGVYPVDVVATDGELDLGSVQILVTVEEPVVVEPFETIYVQSEDATLTILDDGTNGNVTAFRTIRLPTWWQSARLRGHRLCRFRRFSRR